jgi:MFS family permease
MRADIAAGLRYVLGHRLLRPIAMCTSTWNLFGHMYVALLVLFCVRDLGMSPTTLGVALSVGSVGAPLGAAAAPRIGRRLGIGPTIVLSAALGASGLLVALAPRSHPVPFVIAASFIGGVGVIYNITQVSLRQAITDPQFQGRMNATMRFVVWGTIPVGNLLGGALGSALGLRPAMVIGSAGTLLSVIPVVFSPVRSLRTVDEAMPVDALATKAAVANVQRPQETQGESRDAMGGTGIGGLSPPGLGEGHEP